VSAAWDFVLSADAALLGAILSLPHPEWLNRLFETASVAGVGGSIWIAVAALLAAARRIGGRDLLMVVIAIALVHVAVDVVLKPAIARVRPAAPFESVLSEEERPRTPSFPSGHAANAVAAALVLTQRWPHHRAVMWTAAVLVGVARVYLGVHYPGDALAGGLVGLACGYLVLRGFRPRGESGSKGPPRPSRADADGR
jgi:undecaprenyl-diphosphatase